MCTNAESLCYTLEINVVCYLHLRDFFNGKKKGKPLNWNRRRGEVGGGHTGSWWAEHLWSQKAGGVCVRFLREDCPCLLRGDAEGFRG